MGRYPRRHRFIALTPLGQVILGTAVGGAITAALGIFHAAFPPYVLFFWYPPFVGMASYLGGWRAGATAALVSFVLAWFFFVPPANSFMVNRDAVPFTAMFGLALLTMVAAGHRLRKAEEKRIQDVEDHRHLAAIIESSDDAIFSKTLDGIILTWNSGAERLYGYRPAEVIGHPVSKLAPPDRHDEIRTILAQLRRGQRIDHHESVRVKKDGTLINISLTISPVRDESGEITGAATIAHDIGKRKRAIERTVRLQRMATVLSGALTAQAVAEISVDQGLPAIGAQAGSLAVVSADGSRLELLRATGYPPEFIERWRDTPIEQRVAAATAIRTKEPQFFESRESLLQGYGVSMLPFPILSDSGARAVMPLRAGRDILGVLSFLFPERRTFADDERAFIMTVAQLCAHALERARLYEREHHVAVTLQRALLPARLPQAPDVAIHAAYLPGSSESDVGGDWYDVFRLPSGQIAISVGDVVGKGLNAAVVMGQVRQAIRAAALQEPSPSAVLQQAGRVLEWTSGRMATALFGTLDPTDLIFTYASAGHPQPVIITDGHEARVLESHGGLPLGTRGAGSPPPATAVALTPGALLVLYTDGLTELKRNIPEGEATLLAASSAERQLQSTDPAKSIMARVLAGREPRDDIAIVTLSVSAAPLERFSLTLPAEPSSVREARYAFRKLAKTFGIEANDADLFEIALGEAVNNSIEHAYGAEIGTVHVRAWREGADLIVEIEDHGQWRKERAEGRGYGLRIMRVFASSVDVRRELSGTTVRLSLSLGPSTLPVTSERGVGEPPHAVAVDAEAAHGAEVVHASPDGQFRVDHVNGAPVVKIAGDIDLVNADDFGASLESAARTDKRTVIADLTEVSFLDSKAVAVLLNFCARLATNRQRLAIVLPHDNVVRRVLHFAGVEEVIPVFPSLTEALADVTLGNSTIK